MKTARSLTLLALVATTHASSAVVIPQQNITVDDEGYYLQNGLPPIGENSLASKEFYSNIVGSINNNPDSNLTFLERVIGYWNNTHDPNLPLVTTLGLNVENISGVDPDDGISDINSYTAVAGYDYVVFHFGNGPAGQNGNTNADEDGWWSVWYLGGSSKVFNAVPQEGDPLQNLDDVGGFSSARYFNGGPPPGGDDPGDPPKVPDGGTTLASLGIALLGLSGLRRLIKKD